MCWWWQHNQMGRNDSTTRESYSYHWQGTCTNSLPSLFFQRSKLRGAELEKARTHTGWFDWERDPCEYVRLGYQSWCGIIQYWKCWRMLKNAVCCRNQIPLLNQMMCLLVTEVRRTFGPFKEKIHILCFGVDNGRIWNQWWMHHIILNGRRPSTRLIVWYLYMRAIHCIDLNSECTVNKTDVVRLCFAREMYNF